MIWEQCTWGEVLLAMPPVFNFRFPSLTPLVVWNLSALSPRWSYITLADASHAFPLPSGQRNEQRAGQDDPGRGLLGSHGHQVLTLPTLLCMRYWDGEGQVSSFLFLGLSFPIPN